MNAGPVLAVKQENLWSPYENTCTLQPVDTSEDTQKKKPPTKNPNRKDESSYSHTDGENKDWFSGRKGKARADRNQRDPDPRWRDLLCKHLMASVELILEYKSGGQDYSVMYKWTCATIVDNPLPDEVERHLVSLWKDVVHKTERDGPAMDFRLTCVDSKNKVLEKQAARCDLTDYGGDLDHTKTEEATIYAGVLRHNYQLIDERVDYKALIADMAKHYLDLAKALPASIASVSEMSKASNEAVTNGFKMQEHYLSCIIDGRTAAAKHEYDFEKLKVIKHGIDKGVDIAGGELGNALLDVVATKRGEEPAPSDLFDAAKQIRSSITYTQMDTIGFDAAIAFIKLLESSIAVSSEVESLPLLEQAFATLAPCMTALSPLLSSRQKIVLQFTQSRIANLKKDENTDDKPGPSPDS